jgi:hypothetical protein
MPGDAAEPRREDRRMNNIVDFRAGRSRPRRSIQDVQDGAQILFFTGVRYVRDSGNEPPYAAEAGYFGDSSDQGRLRASETALDLTAH